MTSPDLLVSAFVGTSGAKKEEEKQEKQEKYEKHERNEEIDPLHVKHHRGMRGAIIAAAMLSYQRKAGAAATNLWGRKPVDPEQAPATTISAKAIKAGMLEYHQMTSSKWINSWFAISDCGLLYIYRAKDSHLADHILPMEVATIKGTKILCLCIHCLSTSTSELPAFFFQSGDLCESSV
jgi:hypothetical protein